MLNHSDVLSLVRDTITHCQQEYAATLPSPKKVLAPKKTTKSLPAVSPPSSEEKPKTLPVAPAPSFPAPDAMKEKIAEHLPHLQLLPTPKNNTISVAAVCFNAASQPFFKALCKAIQQKICPVRLFDGSKGPLNSQLDKFTLILSEQATGSKNEWVLEPIINYENHPEKKQQLWSKLCQTLSPKSS